MIPITPIEVPVRPGMGPEPGVFRAAHGARVVNEPRLGGDEKQSVWPKLSAEVYVLAGPRAAQLLVERRPFYPGHAKAHETAAEPGDAYGSGAPDFL